MGYTNYEIREAHGHTGSTAGHVYDGRKWSVKSNAHGVVCTSEEADVEIFWPYTSIRWVRAEWVECAATS